MRAELRFNLERAPLTVRLLPDDVIEEDSAGHVTAIRHATTPPTWTRFEPGAVSPEGRDVVVGVIARR